MVGSAMPTTVASMAAMPEPSTVAAITHRPRLVPNESCPSPCAFPSDSEPGPGRFTLTSGASLARPALLQPGEYLGAVLRHGQGVLELRGAPPVGRDRGPTVV